MKKSLITAITLAYICTTYSGTVFHTRAQFDTSNLDNFDNRPDTVIEELQNQFEGVVFTDQNCDAVSVRVQDIGGIKTVIGLEEGNCTVKNSDATNKQIVNNTIHAIQGLPTDPITVQTPPTKNIPKKVTQPTKNTTTTKTIKTPVKTTTTKSTTTTKNSANTTKNNEENSNKSPEKLKNSADTTIQETIYTDSLKSDIIRNLLAAKKQNTQNDTDINEDSNKEPVLTTGDQKDTIIWSKTRFMDITLDPRDIEVGGEIDTETFFIEVQNPALIEAIKQKAEKTAGVSKVKHLLKDIAPELLLIEMKPTADIQLTLSELAQTKSMIISPNYIYAPMSTVDNSRGLAVQSADTGNSDTKDQRYIDFIKGNGDTCHMGPKKVNVAIVDNAFESGHEDLDLNITKKYDVSDKDEDVNPIDPSNEVYNHGTVQAGIIGAEENGEGVTGVSPQANLMLYKAGRDSAKEGTITDGITAIARAYQDGAEVINVSRGGFSTSVMLEKVTKKVADTGVYIVAAAGNYNTDDKFYPAAYDHVIGVAALDESGKRATFSNYGPWVDVAAPGVNMYTTDLNNSYESYSGTSEAAPVVAAAITVAKSYGFDREDLQANLANSTQTGIGEGVIDLRYICDQAREIKREQALKDVSGLGEEDTHNAAGSNNTNYLLLGGGLLILLGLIGTGFSYILHRKDQ